jgi:death on curing protein
VTIYPSVTEAVAAHSRLLETFGGAPGVRDRGALESALARPRSGYYADIIQQAAALLESLSQNHPFVDGNKRTAIAVTAAFLRVNGYKLKLDDREAYEFLIALYNTGEFRFERLEPWLREHASKV